MRNKNRVWRNALVLAPIFYVAMTLAGNWQAGSYHNPDQEIINKYCEKYIVPANERGISGLENIN